MSVKPLIRVAFVKFSPQGKSYALRCNREDIDVGDNVEVLMHADSERTFYMEGVITAISRERWNCRSRVVNLISEVEYEIDADFNIIRTIKPCNASVESMVAWRARKRKYQDGLPQSHRAELRRIYEELAHEDGQPAYLGDGVWITPSGDLEDHNE